MSAVEAARLIDGRYICHRCTAHLADPIPPGHSDIPGIDVIDLWGIAPGESPEPGLTILTVRRIDRRHRQTVKRGQIRAPVKLGYAYPVLMPCRRPSCRQVNRIDGPADPVV